MDDQDLELTVYFDGDCGFCQRVAAWLDAQPKFVRLRCVPARGAAQAGCPLRLEDLLAQVTVIASDGAVYRGSNAWLVCLWALRGFRAWSLRLATPGMRPLADRLFGVVAGIAARTRHAPASPGPGPAATVPR